MVSRLFYNCRGRQNHPMKKYLNSLRKLLGFTRTGSSILGKQARIVLPKKHFQRDVGVLLVGLASSVVFIHQFANIGGTLAFNYTPETNAKITADVRTTHTIQSPLAFSYESRGMSWYHTGADLVAPTSTPVKPIMAGTVEAAINDLFGYGNHVIVRHDDGYESLYGHMSKIEVVEGQAVDLNTELGLSGSTGFSTGPHLHLEVHLNGQLVNPAELVPGVN